MVVKHADGCSEHDLHKIKWVLLFSSTLKFIIHCITVWNTFMIHFESLVEIHNYIFLTFYSKVSKLWNYRHGTRMPVVTSVQSVAADCKFNGLALKIKIVDSARAAEVFNENSFWPCCCLSISLSDPPKGINKVAPLPVNQPFKKIWCNVS